MLPFFILGFGVAAYVAYQEIRSSDYGSRSGNCKNIKSQLSNQIEEYKDLICAICQESIGSRVSIDLTCGNSLHTDCLADWIKHQNKKCLYCGRDIEICSY